MPPASPHPALQEEPQRFGGGALAVVARTAAQLHAVHSGSPTDALGASESLGASSRFQTAFHLSAYLQ